MNRYKYEVRSALIGFISFLLLWQLLHLTISTRVIPGPIDVIVYAFEIPVLLLMHSGASILRIGTALIISLIIARTIQSTRLI